MNCFLVHGLGSWSWYGDCGLWGGGVNMETRFRYRYPETRAGEKGGGTKVDEWSSVIFWRNFGGVVGDGGMGMGMG